MAQWQTADAKNRLADLVEAADGHGPQVVMRHKDVVAVALSPEDYRRLARQADANFGRCSHNPRSLRRTRSRSG
jgi:prevent-host-death family protein